MEPIDIAALREDYKRETLLEADLHQDPIEQFRRWFGQALAAKLAEPNAMTLATVDQHSQPAARIVLLKGLDADGLTFFTNYESRKGQELAQQPKAAVLFCWLELERQVRIEGIVEKVSAQESDDYFAVRPTLSRLGAWASPQSRVLANREVLEEAMKQFQQDYGDNPPRPPHWGGYRLKPHRLEFWQGRRSRLHDRLQYTKSDSGWRIERLAP